MDEINSSGEQSQAAPEDRVKNLQAEMNRKTSNIEEKLAQINQQLQQMSLLGTQVDTNQSNAADEIPDAVLDPKAYTAYIRKEAAKEAGMIIEKQQRQQAELGSLVSMYPELQDSSSDLTKEALRIYNSMSPQDKSNSLAYKSAIQSAALDLGILPKHKRQQKSVQNDNSEDIGSGQSNNQQRQQSKKQGKLDPATIAFAKALGKDVNDPKYLERLEKTASRQVWSKYQGRD